MLNTNETSRRQFLSKGLLIALGATFGGLSSSCSGQAPGDNDVKQRSEISSPPHPIPASYALSLGVLQEEASSLSGRLPDDLAYLGGMNKIRGFMSTPDRELLLLGDREPKIPSIHIDDLTVALRNAYRVSLAYQDALGCTIDPWPGAKDPWRIQKVKVLGMPPTTSMAARHVAIDYELKKVSAGTLSLGDGIRSLWELNRSGTAPCEGSSKNNKETVHRFWFTARYPSPPRFSEEESAVFILKPVEVQLLTERQFFDRSGNRSGSAEASPEADTFADLVTRLLATNQIRKYASLVNDFRIIELGALLRFKRIPEDNLRYLLRQHPLTDVAVPSFVGGIRREESGEVVCDVQITESRTPNGIQIQSKELKDRYHIQSRGGVEAKVVVTNDQFLKQSPNTRSELQRRILAARRSPRSLMWAIK